jgi:hypothetical protein
VRDEWRLDGGVAKSFTRAICSLLGAPSSRLVAALTGVPCVL